MSEAGELLPEKEPMDRVTLARMTKRFKRKMRRLGKPVTWRQARLRVMVFEHNIGMNKSSRMSWRDVVGQD